ncbi:MAG: hypothetical protein KC646_05500 [Candidatus Cloacimonetes bacterium]|nr:hypothetical protein [Candidatus Cloacimonadota bacterium]
MSLTPEDVESLISISEEKNDINVPDLNNLGEAGLDRFMEASTKWTNSELTVLNQLSDSLETDLKKRFNSHDIKLFMFSKIHIEEFSRSLDNPCLVGSYALSSNLGECLISCPHQLIENTPDQNDFYAFCEEVLECIGKILPPNCNHHFQLQALFEDPKNIILNDNSESCIILTFDILTEENLCQPIDIVISNKISKLIC